MKGAIGGAYHGTNYRQDHYPTGCAVQDRYGALLSLAAAQTEQMYEQR